MESGANSQHWALLRLLQVRERWLLQRWCEVEGAGEQVAADGAAVTFSGKVDGEGRWLPW